MGDIYRLGDLEGYHKAPKISESFSRLLDKPVASSHYIAMSLDKCVKLESCVRGLVESQSFTSCTLAVVFAFLKDSGCALENDIFHRLVASLTVALNAQAKAMFAATAFMKQKQQETLVSYLPAATHPSVEHALLMTLSSDMLFAEEVIRDLLTQVREDSHLTLLKNLFSGKGDKRAASPASTSSQRKPYSSTFASFVLGVVFVAVFCEESSWD